MNLTQIIERTRDILGEHQTQSQEWSDPALLRHLNAGLDEMWRKGQQADEQWGLDYALLSDFNTTITEFGIDRIKIQFNEPPLGRIKRIEETNGTYPDTEIPCVDLQFVDQEVSAWPNLIYNKRSWWPGANNRIMFMRKTGQTLAPANVRLWFERKPPHMVRFTVVAGKHTSDKTLVVNAITGATADPVSNAKMGTISTIKGYYNNASIECVSNAGNSPQGLGFMVTTWAAATYPEFTMTIEPSDGFVADPGVSTTWEVCPYWPEEHHELVAALGARNALLIGNDFEGKKAVDIYAGTALQQFIEVIENRQYQSGRRVRFTEE